MPELLRSGGLMGCCGLDGYHSFDTRGLTVDDLNRQFPINLSWVEAPEDHACVMRIMAFTGNQEGRLPELWTWLQEHPNIREVAKWENSNSGATIHLMAYGAHRLEAIERPVPGPAQVREVPVHLPTRWRLYRIRFDDNGLVNRQVRAHEWQNEPRADLVQRAIVRFKEQNPGRSQDRWRFELKEEPIAADD